MAISQYFDLNPTSFLVFNLMKLQNTRQLSYEASEGTDQIKHFFHAFVFRLLCASLSRSISYHFAILGTDITFYRRKIIRMCLLYNNRICILLENGTCVSLLNDEIVIFCLQYCTKRRNRYSKIVVLKLRERT